MSKSFITIILLVISICGASAKSSAALNSSLSTQQLLDSLDSSLGKSAAYTAEKERRISSLRRRLSQTANPEQRFWICRNLVDDTAPTIPTPRSTTSTPRQLSAARPAVANGSTK